MIKACTYIFIDLEDGWLIGLAFQLLEHCQRIQEGGALALVYRRSHFAGAGKNVWRWCLLLRPLVVAI